MGKSDPIIFDEYKKILKKNESHIESVAFLGFSCENDLTLSIKCKKRDFYDLSLGNWEINSDWSLGKSYDLIVCTRCAYFSRDPVKFIQKCKLSLKSSGHALIDWGLGDHWRFPNFKVGWVKDNEHESAYSSENLLYSCFWRNDLEDDVEVKNFWKAVIDLNVGYNVGESLSDIVRREVPSIVDYEFISLKTKFLWKENPQLYIITWI